MSGTDSTDYAELIERLNGPVRQAAQDLIDAAFNNRRGRGVQFSIPARPDEDTDLVLVRGIEEAADAIAAVVEERDSLRERMKILERRIHNQRVALRQDWQITEMRMRDRSHYARSKWLDHAMTRARELHDCRAERDRLRAALAEAVEVVTGAEQFLTKWRTDALGRHSADRYFGHRAAEKERREFDEVLAPARAFLDKHAPTTSGHEQGEGGKA